MFEFASVTVTITQVKHAKKRNSQITLILRAGLFWTVRYFSFLRWLWIAIGRHFINRKGGDDSQKQSSVPSSH